MRYTDTAVDDLPLAVKLGSAVAVISGAVVASFRFGVLGGLTVLLVGLWAFSGLVMAFAPRRVPAGSERFFASQRVTGLVTVLGLLVGAVLGGWRWGWLTGTAFYLVALIVGSFFGRALLDPDGTAARTVETAQSDLQAAALVYRDFSADLKRAAYPGCLFRPAEVLRHPKAEVRRALETFLSAPLPRHGRGLEQDLKKLSVLRELIDFFIDVPVAELPQEPAANLATGLAFLERTGQAELAERARALSPSLMPDS